MKYVSTLALALVCLFVLGSAASADTPAYRAAFTATGSNPTVTVTPQVGDAIFVFALSGEHAFTDLNEHTATEDGGAFLWDQACQSIWKRGSKYAKFNVLLRDQLASSTTPIHISVDTGGKTGVAIAIAVSGLTAINNQPSNGCGWLNATNHSVRQIKNNLYDITDGSGPFVPGEVPMAPKFGQANAFASTSMMFAVLADDQQTPSVAAPSSFSQRVTAGVGGSKAIGMSIATLDSGYSGSSVTWGSAAAANGNVMVVELQPIQ